MSQVNKLLGRVNNDLERPFLCTKEGYCYYTSFLEESKGLIEIKSLKFKDDELAAFKNYKALREKQSCC